MFIIELNVGDKFIHYKNKKVYEVISEAYHTEEDYTLVIYRDSDNRIWARPKDMFCESISYQGGIVNRFEKITIDNI